MDTDPFMVAYEARQAKKRKADQIEIKILGPLLFAAVFTGFPLVWVGLYLYGTTGLRDSPGSYWMLGHFALIGLCVLRLMRHS